MTARSGRHFLQIPGPTNVPDRILRALAQPTIDHRGPEFGQMGKELLEGLRRVFKTSGPVIMYPASGTGAWEAALVNTLSPGDRVLMFETGHFATLWKDIATRFGLAVDFVPGDWRRGVEPAVLEAKLAEDRGHAIRAVAVVHNETSTAVESRIPELRRAIDAAKHPALFLVDTVSSLGCMDYRHDEWGVDVTVSASQKGLMLPPGLSFNALGPKAIAAAKSARLPRSYWDWEQMIRDNAGGYFPYTPATSAAGTAPGIPAPMRDSTPASAATPRGSRRWRARSASSRARRSAAGSRGPAAWRGGAGRAESRSAAARAGRTDMGGRDYSARASATTTIERAPARRRAREAASAVAPVVTTSSRRTTSRPFTAPVAANAPATFRARSSRERPTCARVSRVRASAARPRAGREGAAPA